MLCCGAGCLHKCGPCVQAVLVLTPASQSPSVMDGTVHTPWIRALVLSVCVSVCLRCAAPADIVSTLRAAHGADPTGTRQGVDVLAGGAGDMAQLGVYESYKVKKQVRTEGGGRCLWCWPVRVCLRQRWRCLGCWEAEMLWCVCWRRCC